MRAAGKKYGYTFHEYMLFDFEHRTPEELHEFMSDKERLGITLRLNSQEIRDLLDSKYDTYFRFKKYYKRDVEMIAANDRTALKAFLADHGALIAKANTDFGGYGNGDKVKIFNPVLRIGAGGAEIDSALSNGGILTSVDIETGTITHASDEACHRFVNHPDAGKPIIGFRLPRWDEALELVHQLSLELDDMHYAGWDVALTEDGWKMIEGNACGMFIWQIPLCKGFRAQFEQIISELGLEKYLEPQEQQ